MRMARSASLPNSIRNVSAAEKNSFITSPRTKVCPGGRVGFPGDGDNQSALGFSRRGVLVAELSGVVKMGAIGIRRRSLLGTVELAEAGGAQAAVPRAQGEGESA